MPSSLLTLFSATLAIFSMFFGAGNVVFPLVLGQTAGNNISLAMVGLLLTAIGGPLLGLFGSMLYQGDCKRFFFETGRIPGLLLLMICFILLGPFAVMPRCLIVSYAAVKAYLPSLNFVAYSFLSTALMLLLIIKRNNLLPVLGLILSPILLGSLLFIIFAGLNSPVSLETVQATTSNAFVQGLSVGYDTMDLIAALFFSSTIWSLLSHKLHAQLPTRPSILLRTTLISSLLSAFLLSLIYIGLSYVTAKHSHLLSNTLPEELLIRISNHLLGPRLAIAANIAVALACITTIMSLAVTMSDVVYQDFLAKKIDYRWILIGIMLITLALSNLGFKNDHELYSSGRITLLSALIALTLCNIVKHFWGFNYTKATVFITFLTTLVFMVVVQA